MISSIFLFTLLNFSFTLLIFSLKLLIFSLKLLIPSLTLSILSFTAVINSLKDFLSELTTPTQLPIAKMVPMTVKPPIIKNMLASNHSYIFLSLNLRCVGVFSGR